MNFMKIDGSGQRKTQRGVCFRAHGKRAVPSGYKLSRAKAFFWPVFGTESRPTGAPEASRRGEGGLLTGLRHGDLAYRYLRGILAWQSVLLGGLWHGDLAHKYLRAILAWRSIT